MEHFVSGFFHSVLFEVWPCSSVNTGFFHAVVRNSIVWLYHSCWWTFVLCSPLVCMHLFPSFPLGTYLGMEFLVNRIGMGSPLLQLLTSFPNMLFRAYQWRMRISLASYFCKYLEFFLECIVRSHFASKFHFPSEFWGWTPFHWLFGNLGIFLCKLSIHIFCPFFKNLVVCLFPTDLYNFFLYCRCESCIRYVSPMFPS